jgi:hypothetical protein
MASSGWSFFLTFKSVHLRQRLRRDGAVNHTRSRHFAFAEKRAIWLRMNRRCAYFHRLTLRSATGFSQREKHHQS